MQTLSLADFEFEIRSFMARGQFAAAAAAAARCRAAWPSHPAGWLLGSISELCDDKKDAALALIERYLVSYSGDAQCLCRLQQAECLMALGRRSEALAAADEAAAGRGADSSALDAVGQFLVNARAYAQAMTVYDRAVAQAPENPSILAKRSIMHRFLGNFDLAARDHEAILALSPSDPEALKGLVYLHRQTTDRNSIPALEAALATAPGEATATLHFALAKCHEDLGDFTTSWRHLAIGNKLERSRIDYDGKIDSAVIDLIISGFPQIEALRPDTTGARPIFIVGLPRTGTTLVERITGSHSQVHSAGELPALSQAIARSIARAVPAQTRSWQEFAASLAQFDGESIARDYLILSLPQRGEQVRFSDKQPTNFFYCALILRAFPNAHIVHLTRHPLAACYAIYKTQFDAGFPFAYDLEELADFYIGYRRLMSHWHRVLPGRIHDIAYEDIVTAQPVTTQRLLEYLDLPFEQSCLDFHLSRAPMTTTASAVQVSQPLFDSSVHQWRHFAAQLAPLRARLEAAGIRID
jgi:tetratricopeptide (TPR) repeat protein